MIKEIKMDRLSTPWVMVRASCLLSWQGTVAEDPGTAGDGAMEEGAAAPVPAVGQDLDEPVFTRESVRLGPFQMQILECKVKLPIGESAHVMVMPLRAGESQPGGVQPLPPGLHVLHVYTRLKMSSNKVSVVVRNMSESPLFLKKGVQVARVVSMSLVPPAELSLVMEAILAEEVEWTPLTVAEQQKRLLKKLNLDGLGHWTPWNAVAAQDLVLAFYDIFTLEGSELACMRSRSLTVSLLRSISGAYLHCFLRRCMPRSVIHWIQGQYAPANLLGVKLWYWSGRRMSPCHFCVDFCKLNA